MKEISDRFWGLLSNWYWEIFPGVKAAREWNWPLTSI